MRKAKLTFRLLGYWHMGSGLGEGPNLDAVVIKTPGKLPFIPGRTVKGLLREGTLVAEEAGALPPGTTDRLFGGGDRGDRFGTIPGELSFSSAGLGAGMEVWAEAEKNEKQRQLLYRSLASTALSSRGLAADNTLRRIEVAIPLTLLAEATGPKDDWISTLQTAARLVRQLGSHRHRGLGRVEISVEEVPA